MPSDGDLSFWEVPHTDIVTNVSSNGEQQQTNGYIAKGSYKDQPVTVIRLSSMDCASHQENLVILTKPRHPCLLLFMAVSFNHPSRCPVIVTEPIDYSLSEACTVPSKLDSFSSRVTVMIDVGRALHYLHTHKEAITHGNVNSDNVFIHQPFSGVYRGKLSCTNIRSASLEAAKQPPEVRKISSYKVTTKVDVYGYGLMLMEVFKLPKEANVKATFPFLKLPLIYEETRKCTVDNPDDRPDIIDVLQVIKSLLDD